jgi:hypothetical protein
VTARLPAQNGRWRGNRPGTASPSSKSSSTASTTPGGQTRLAAQWQWLPVGLTGSGRRASSGRARHPGRQHLARRRPRRRGVNDGLARRHNGRTAATASDEPGGGSSANRQPARPIPTAPHRGDLTPISGLEGVPAGSRLAAPVAWGGPLGVAVAARCGALVEPVPAGPPKMDEERLDLVRWLLSGGKRERRPTAPSGTPQRQYLCSRWAWKPPSTGDGRASRSSSAGFHHAGRRCWWPGTRRRISRSRSPGTACTALKRGLLG